MTPHIHQFPKHSSLRIPPKGEQPVQLLKEKRRSITATQKHAKRVDYEYERVGTACLFMFTEPLDRWRKVSSRPQRTKVDWAFEMKELLRTKYADAEKIILISDNLNTHTRSAFYEARSLISWINFFCLAYPYPL